MRRKHCLRLLLLKVPELWMWISPSPQKTILPMSAVGKVGKDHIIDYRSGEKLSSSPWFYLVFLRWQFSLLLYFPFGSPLISHLVNLKLLLLLAVVMNNDKRRQLQSGYRKLVETHTFFLQLKTKDCCQRKKISPPLLLSSLIQSLKKVCVCVSTQRTKSAEKTKSSHSQRLANPIDHPNSHNHCWWWWPSFQAQNNNNNNISKSNLRLKKRKGLTL